MYATLFTRAIRICGLLSLFISCFAYAGEVTVSDVSARGQAMQAYSAVVDDPSAIFYNPGALAQVKGTQIQGNAIYVTHDQRYKNSLTRTMTHSYPKLLAPTVFFSTDRFKNMVFGIGIYTPYGRQADYHRNSAVYNLIQKSNLARTDFAPTVAFNINRYISVGLGFVASRVLGYTEILGFNEKGDGYGYTGQGGILIRIPQKKIKLALSYRGHEFVKLYGHGQIPGIQGKFHAGLNFPAIISVGASWQPTEHLLVSANYDYELWSTLEKFQRKYDHPVLHALGNTIINSRNSETFRIGMRITINPKNQVAVGYSYINAGVPAAYIIPALPDYSGFNSAIGFTHYFSKKLRVDATYVYIYGPDRKSPNVVFPGKYSIKGNTFLIGVNYIV